MAFNRTAVIRDFELSENRKKSVSDNESFVSLIQLAKEDKEIKNRILMILKLDSFNRISLLNTFISEMNLKGAPEDFVEAFFYLKDDSVANEAIKIITNA